MLSRSLFSGEICCFTIREKLRHTPCRNSEETMKDGEEEGRSSSEKVNSGDITWLSSCSYPKYHLEWGQEDVCSFPALTSSMMCLLPYLSGHRYQMSSCSFLSNAHGKQQF
eukprot:gene4714-3406_t